MVTAGQDPREHLVELLGDLVSALEKLEVPNIREEGVGPNGWHPAISADDAMRVFMDQSRDILTVTKKLQQAANGQIAMLLSDAPEEVKANFQRSFAEASGDIVVTTQIMNLEMQMAYSSSEKNYPDVLRSAEELIKRNPDHGKAHISKIFCMLVMNRQDEAREASAVLQKSNAP